MYLYKFLPISHLTVIGGFGGRGMVSQSIHKDIRKALTISLARSAAIFFKGSPTGQNAELSRAQRGDFFRTAPTSQNAEKKKKKRREEKKRTLI